MLKWALISLMLICLTVPCAEAADAKLLFKSGFEGSVQIVPWGLQNHNNRHTIEGYDKNYAWPDDLPGDKNNQFFYYAVSDDNHHSDFIRTDIVTVEGRHGKMSRALYQEVLQDDQDDPALSRNQFNLHPSDTNSFERMYVRYWIKFQSDLDSIMPKNSWRMLMEWYESGNDYVFNLMVIKTADDGKMKWKLTGRIVKPTSEYDWIEINDEIQVPIGEWFLLEVFWKHSSDPDGQILVKVNHDEVFNHLGRNRLDSDLMTFSPFKVYGGTDFHQWIDDFEIWDNLPEFTTPRPPDHIEFFLIKK